LIIVIFELLFFKEQIYDLIGLSFLLGD